MSTRAPVALIIYRRPDLAKQVFDVIKAAKPSKLFIFADGPSADRPGEAEKCEAAREAVEHVSWDCDVVRDYSAENMGPWRRIASGITSAFEEVEELIVFEDDCVPDPTFFPFCDELLERYRYDERVMHISGNHFHPEDPRRISHSYSFAWHNIAWGYATWRRAWQHFDLAVPTWGQLRETDFLEQIVREPEAVAHYQRLFDELYDDPGNVDGYDYAWSFACWSQRGLSVLPKTTLVRHEGFGPGATHFQKPPNDPRHALRVRPMDFPLHHPPFLLRDAAADEYIINTYVVRRKPRASLGRRVYRKIRRLVSATMPDPIRSAVSRWLFSARRADVGTGASG